MSTAIKVLVNGAFGRMGQLVVKAIEETSGLKIVGRIGREYALKDSIKDSQAQVVVDFTHPDAVFANTSAIIEMGAHPVIGTSGLTQQQIKTLQEKCATLKLGGLIAPNFSLGAVLMMKYAKEIAKWMPHVEIIEMHHDDKADSPSGTAIRSAELLAEAVATLNQPLKADHENIRGARGAKHRNIPIHAIRLPGLLAHQEIIFGNRGETLTLRHDSIDRQSFMPGICLACKKVMTLDHLAYGLEDLL